MNKVAGPNFRLAPAWAISRFPLVNKTAGRCSIVIVGQRPAIERAVKTRPG